MSFNFDKKYLKYASYVIGAVALVTLVSTNPVHVLVLAGAAGLYFLADR